MFLSFIIPVYNTQTYLDALLDSLSHQDLTESEYEIICVNDGSTDGSLSVLQKWQRSAGNIVVIDQPNSGVSIARNNGLDRASGDYVWFVDADDLVRENILGALKEKTDKTDFDRIVFGNYAFSTSEPCGDMQKNTFWEDSVVWRSIFKRDYLLVNDLRFHYPELVFGEDALFMYEMKRFGPSTLILEECLYFHRVRSGSAGYEESSIESKMKKLRSNMIEAQVMKKYYEEENLLPETADRLMSFLWGTMYRTAELPADVAAPIIKELKMCGLYPYRRPKECEIRKINLLPRGDYLETIFDKIYTNLHTRWGYHGMRSWFALFRLKEKLVKKE